ncbi:nuclear envelope protein [Calycina marina]|uniref:Nuclear envelope protein n=1 Tax=Calycina marina TaxID=1763456 RepID=A0A9P7Z0I7_9HELO|nr:nuclear envelope protein [Calycina marina]
MPPPLRIRPYKDFLTPALHRRFVMGMVSFLGFCYLEALMIGEWNSLFWSWFPLGRAGIRTLLLFIPGLMIFVLRVAQLHVGIRTSNSSWETFKTYVFRPQTIHTLVWYSASAYLYSEVYIWSQSVEADMNRIKIQKKTERPVLNERPIYLTSFMLFLAVVQTVFHLYDDYDQIDMASMKNKPAAKPGQQVETIIPASKQMRAKLPQLLARSAVRAAAMSAASPFIYSFTVRNFAWSFTRFFARVFWNLPKSGALPSIGPFHWSVLIRTCSSGFLLIMLWEVSNALFSAHVAQEPLKNDRPITYESKDPNGSLLTGLKGQKLQTRAFAFRELVYIAQDFQGRRKNIFEDIDRRGGTTWTQILNACLDVITCVNSRIDSYNFPAVAELGVAAEEPQSTLQRIGKPLKDGFDRPGDIFNTPPRTTSTGAGIVQAVGSFAKSHGHSPEAKFRARKLIEQAESVVITPEQQNAGLGTLFKQWAAKLLQYEVGKPFRQEFRRRIAVITLGSPYGDVGVIVDAVDSLTKLAVFSLAEDHFGNVQRDIRIIIQTFTNTIRKLENFKASLSFHWTDVEKKRESPEVDEVLTALRGGLEQLITSFGGYSKDLRLSPTDLRLAQEAATPARPQMEQVQI